VLGFLFVSGSRSDSNVCVRKAALKSARSGPSVPLRRGKEGRGSIAAIRRVDVSCPVPAPCLADRVTEAQEARYSFLAVPTSTFNRKRACFEEPELSSSKATAAVG